VHVCERVSAVLHVCVCVCVCVCTERVHIDKQVFVSVRMRARGAVVWSACVSACARARGHAHKVLFFAFTQICCTISGQPNLDGEAGKATEGVGGWVGGGGGAGGGRRREGPA
jgi:hypothetical protein